MLFLPDYCSIFDILVYLKYMSIRYEHKLIEARASNKSSNKWIILKHADDNLLLHEYSVLSSAVFSEDTNIQSEFSEKRIVLDNEVNTVIT